MIKKKGLSQIVSVVLLILLTIALIGIVWVFINNLIESKIDSADSCMNLVGKIEINSEYTCYNETSKELYVSIRIKELDKPLTSLLVGIVYLEDSFTFNLENEEKDILNVSKYPNRGSGVKLPPEESVRTYIIERQETPSEIQLSPKIGKTQCGISDSLQSVNSCQ